MNVKTFRVLAVLAASVYGAASSSPVQAQTANFYAGKTVQVLVGFPTGGGYDAYARALAQFLPNHIPGKPQVVVENMTGAGSLRLALYLQTAAPKDGLTFGTMDNGLLIASLLRPDLVNFNASTLSWLGSTTRELQLCSTWSAFPAKQATDLRTMQAVFGATGPDDIRYESTQVLKNVIGANVKMVTGYPGTTDIRVAMENGELNGVCDSWQSLKATKPEWLRDKKLNLLVQMASARNKELPDVPTIAEFARSPGEAQALDLIFSSGEAGRPFGAPPGIPQDRLQILRRAFDETVKDPGYLDFTRKANLEVDPITGGQTEEFLKKVYAYPPSVVATARKLIE
jgi:tripartite-type tricarboxylate transporter receptor subunit TctC